MRIKGMRFFLGKQLKTQKLNGSTVVIDGQNYFFKMYKESNIPYALGCESDRFASYLRNDLEKFKKANVKCYFVIKGGHTDRISLDVHFEGENRLHGKNYVVGKTYDDIIMPIFTKDIWFEVLDEMGFEYIVCNDDAVTECITLARKFSCPVICFSVKYFFSCVQYIPEPSIVLAGNNILLCGVITLSDVLSKFNLKEEKIILFVMLTDLHIFDETVFVEFFRSHRIIKKNIFVNLLGWLSRNSKDQALKEIFKFLTESDRKLFLEKMSDFENLMQKRKNEDTDVASYVLDKNNAKITDSDSDWFEKGVLSKHIPIPYINLYRFKIIKASNKIEDYEQENSVMLSIDILKYAYDLLTNFEGGEIYVEHKKSSSDTKNETLTYNSSVRKPDHVANSSFFENGWDNIKRLELFQHFITEILQTFNFDRLNKAPADSRLLLVAIIYFSRKKQEVKSEVFSILLSYVMLAVVSEKVNDEQKQNESRTSVPVKPFLDSITDKDSVTASDCAIAWNILGKYFKVRVDEMCSIFSREVLHPLVEFQRCLQELNYLNQLCGLPFDATVYSKTYNGTFIYKILRSINGEDPLEFIKNKLNPAPTVLAFVCGLVDIYESIMYDI